MKTENKAASFWETLRFSPHALKGRLLLQKTNYAQANTPSWYYWTPKPQAIRMYGHSDVPFSLIQAFLYPCTCLGRTTLPYQSPTTSKLDFQNCQQQRSRAWAASEAYRQSPLEAWLELLEFLPGPSARPTVRPTVRPPDRPPDRPHPK